MRLRAMRSLRWGAAGAALREGLLGVARALLAGAFLRWSRGRIEAEVNTPGQASPVSPSSLRIATWRWGGVNLGVIVLIDILVLITVFRPVTFPEVFIPVVAVIVTWVG